MKLFIQNNTYKVYLDRNVICEYYTTTNLNRKLGIMDITTLSNNKKKIIGN